MMRCSLIVEGTRETCGEGFSHSSGSLDGSETRWTHVVMNLTVFCSQEFVVVLYKCFLYDLFFRIHFTRNSRASTVTRVVDFRHLCLPQFYGIAKKLHSSRLSFTDRRIL